MIKYFRRQTGLSLTKDDLPKLTSKTFYDKDWCIDDRMFYFYMIEDINEENEEFSVNLKICCEDEFQRLMNDCYFVKMKNKIPIFIRKEENEKL